MPAERRLETRIVQERRATSSLGIPLGAAVAGWVVTGGLAVLVLAAGARPDEQLLVGALFGWPGAVVAFLAWGLWFGARQDRPRVAQAATLTGSRLHVEAPEACDVDLEREHAIVLGVTGAHASVRVLRSAGDVVLHVERSEEPAALPGVPAAEALPWTGVRTLGLPEARRELGNALVAAALAARSRNRYETWLATLRAIEVEAASDPHTIRLPEPLEPPRDGDRDRSAYRSGRLAPGDPGYEALLAREGHSLAEGLVVGPAHLVARDSEGARHAFPLGRVRATRSAGALRLGTAVGPSATGTDEGACVPLEDAALAHALLVWLDERANAAAG